ncbi:MAG: hypothetical protein M1820_007145 [Bogoriella megaspora]|nr:MAG: hypothetical protein M1820_007145 [Bogoriella megaspora]
MDDLEFLKLRPPGKASLTVTFPDGVVSTIDDINVEVLSERCLLLALAFEDGPRGLKYSIDGASLAVVASFLRYLYLGDYRCVEIDGTLRPCSLLLHAELCRMASIYDVPGLSDAARCNIEYDTQQSLSYPNPPDELSEAIAFIYTKLNNHAFQKPLIDSILHYCVSCFVQHNLAGNDAFCRLVFDLEPFHKDLHRINLEREFVDDGAPYIIRLPDCKIPPPSDAIREFVAVIFCCSPVNEQAASDPTSRRSTEGDTSTDERPFVLVHRPKIPIDESAIQSGTESEGETSTPEDEGFMLVKPPKQSTTTAPPTPRAPKEPSRRQIPNFKTEEDEYSVFGHAWDDLLDEATDPEWVYVPK